MKGDEGGSIRCPVESCGAIVVVHPQRVKTTTRNGWRSRRSLLRTRLRGHIDRHRSLSVRERSLLLDRALSEVGL